MYFAVRASRPGLSRHACKTRAPEHTTPKLFQHVVCKLITNNNVQAEPVIFLMPFLYVVLDKCTFGMDKWLFVTHCARLAATFAHTTYADTWQVTHANVLVRLSARVQWCEGERFDFPEHVTHHVYMQHLNAH